MSERTFESPDWARQALADGRHLDDADPKTREVLRILLELEGRRCQEDYFYWARTYGRILDHNTAQVIPFVMTPEQEDFARAMFDEPKLIDLKARQIGLSTVVGMVCFWEVFFHSNWETLFLSRKEDDAIVLLDKSKMAYDALPQWLKDWGPQRTTNNTTELRFDQGGVIRSVQSKNEPARSRSVRRLVADEFSFFEDQVKATASFGPTADNGAYLTLLSTANGIGDEFERMVKAARVGTKNGGWPITGAAASNIEPNGWAFRFYNWRARKGRDDAWYEGKRKEMLPHLLAQEFPNDPDEAFRTSGNLYFDPDIVASWLPEVGDRGHLIDAEWHPDDESGPVTVYAQPVKGARYALAVDPGGERDGDPSVLMVLRCSTGQHVASMELREEGDRVAAEARALGQYYNWALCGVEANGVGKAVLLELKRLKYPKVYTRWIYDTKVKTQTKKLGWYTTAANKESMLGAMWRLLREGHVTSTEVRFIKEMGEYRRYSDAHGRVIRLGGQPHDDWVMAMAIGVQMLQHLGADYIDRLDDPEELPALTPGRIDYGHGFDGWFKLGSKTTTEQQWKSNTIPKRVRTTSVGNDGAFMRPSELSGSTPRRLTRTGR